MNHDRSVNEYLEKKKEYIPVDVRSPQEYHNSRIPNAVNVPLFNDEERAEIGTIYRQIGKKEAKWRAMELVSPKLPEMLGTIRQLKTTGKAPIIYCWRGGMRSRAVVLFAEMSGLDICRLEGGFRAYRETTVKKIPELIPDQAIVIDGVTGTGKTTILQRLKKLGYPVLDLEQYANHKGSVFGALAAGQIPHNQKMFDALLFEDLHELAGIKTDYFIMEGESQRIGRVVQPSELYEKKYNGIHIRVTSTLEKRVDRIYKEYVQNDTDAPTFQERVREALKWIIERVKSPSIRKEILLCLEKENYRDMIELLMVHYYDPFYINKIDEVSHLDLVVNSDSIEKAVEEIADYIDHRICLRQSS